jgi:hypothetical protein
MVKHLVRAIFTVALLTLMGVSAYAQSLGEIKGTVTDTNGAVVVGATVEVTNEGTGDKRTVTTDDSGNYSVPKLIPGSYTVSASQTNFAVATVQKVIVSVSFATNTDLTLNPAGGSEVVTVSTGDAATQLNTTDQQLSTIIDNKKILELPLLSRDPNALILLAPGTTQTTSALGGFSVNGQRERNNNFLVDGVDNNDTDVPGIPGGLATPNIDATQEFRVLTSNFNAEYGRNTGAVVLVATKNGTNDFHGGAYIYYRSDRFAARDFFDVSGSADPLQRKQFGASIGGPIKKERAFFFFNYEGDRLSQGSQQDRLVPSAAARMGILNLPAPGTSGPQNDANGTFGTIDIRPGMFGNNAFGFPFSPAITQLINTLYPLPNRQGTVPGVFDFFSFGYTFVNTQDSIASRIDYKITDKHNLTGSYNFNNGNFGLFADTFPGTGDGGDTPQRTHLVSLNLVSSFTPTLINEVRFGYNKAQSQFNGQGDGKASTKIDDAIRTAFTSNGIPVPGFGDRNGQALNLITGSIASLTAFDTQGRDTGTTTIGDSFTWIKGSHTIKFGGEYRWIKSDGDTNFGRSESLVMGLSSVFNATIVNYRFTDAMGNVITRAVPRTTGTGLLINNYLSFLSGFVAQQTQSQYFNTSGTRTPDDFRRFRVREYDFFFQDTWRVRSNFTLNFGLRYENKGVPFELDGMLSNLAQDSSIATPAAGFEFITVGKNSAHPNQGLYDEDKNNWAPRFGFNYSPGFKDGWLSKLTGGPGNMTIRGGYGIFYDRVFGNLFSNARGNPPFQQDFFSFPPAELDDFTLNGVPRPPLQVSSPFVQEGQEIFPVLFPLAGNNPYQSKFATPYTQAWNFGFQRELGNAFLLEADYVGSHSANVLMVVDGQLTSVPRINALTGSNIPISTSLTTNILNGRFNDAFFQTALNLSLGHSTYNALQTRITKTLTNSKWGLGQIQGAYTWSHSIDNSTDALVPTNANTERSFPRDSSGFAGGWNAERGNSGFDVRQRLVVNFIYDLPFHYTSAWGKYLLNDWTFSSIAQFQSGRPFSAFANGVDSQGTGLSARAFFAGSQPGLAPTPANLQNPRAQTGPSRTMFLGAPCTASVTTNCIRLNGQQGNVPRNFFEGPGFNKVDVSVLKGIPINERVKFQIRADFFNIFNRVNFDTPISNVNDNRFGQSTNTVSTPRIIQFVGRFTF